MSFASTSHRSGLGPFYLTCLLAIGGLAASASGPARANMPVPTVLIQAPAATADVRTDVATACPTVQATLGGALQEAWEHVQEAGVVQVQFQLQDGHLSEVHTSDGPRRYHRLIRAAVKQLPCQSDSALPQRFRFNVAFVER